MSATHVLLVHHRNYPDVLDTVTECIKNSSSLGQFIVVDNSEDEELQSRLLVHLPSTVQLLIVPNSGYGSAVNAGVDQLVSNGALGTDYVLVITHEVRFGEGAIDRLRHALVQDETLGAVGPVLYDRNASGDVWSWGGELTPLLRRPRHALNPGDSVRWLDGAAVLYRLEPFAAEKFDPVWVMYYEEVDLHLRWASRGWRVAVVPDVRAYQTTGGTGPYYKARNSLLFARVYAPWWAVPLAFARECAAVLWVARTHPRDVPTVIKSMSQGLHSALSQPSAND